MTQLERSKENNDSLATSSYEDQMLNGEIVRLCITIAMLRHTGHHEACCVRKGSLAGLQTTGRQDSSHTAHEVEDISTVSNPQQWKTL